MEVQSSKIIFKNTLFLSFTGSFGILFGNDVSDVKEYIKQNNGTFPLNNYKSACLGFLMNFFNKKNECPKIKNNKEICHHSDYIKIQFDDGNDETEKNSKCGINSVTHITE